MKPVYDDEDEDAIDMTEDSEESFDEEEVMEEVAVADAEE